ncbi:MAG TPA: segregation/condensation protein A, partial [Candidatus Eisenbacteria bacterium]|nr:segregation/condensation protein A [Candidatus Eisenbacteria bacterium]
MTDDRIDSSEPETPVAASATRDTAAPAAEPAASATPASPSVATDPNSSPARAAIRVNLPAFEGPLDLLLHLIQQNEIEITDIPISKITKQYLEMLDLMRELDLEVAGEFL